MDNESAEELKIGTVLNFGDLTASIDEDCAKFVMEKIIEE